jgi:hypothetical protein
MGLKSKAYPVFFFSLVGVDKKGIVDDHESIFDIYTKFYDFVASDVVVQSSQDLWDFYVNQNKSSDKKNVDIYTLVEYFVQSYSNAHYVLDEVPFITCKCQNYYYFSIKDCKTITNSHYFC